MATKKQSRSKVQGVVNPRGVTAIYGTPIDFKALPEKITIGRRVANGKFKLEAHYPAKHFNDKQTYVDKRKEGSYCRFYDKKSPFFIARTVWDATSQPGMHMIVKNRGETHRFIVTPKVDDPTKASVIGSYLVHRDNGDPVLCSGVIGELEAAGDDGDFKVTPYQNHGIRCPKFDDQKKELAGHIPQTFEYKKSTKPRGPRKTAADYCKPTHTFKHPTDIKKAEMIADMDDEMDDAVSCLKCRWDGSYEDLVFVDADGTGGGGYDFHLACPVCEEDEWLDDMMAEGVDEPCFSCDGIGHWDDGDCGYCAGSGLMSDTLRAEMAMFNNEYFDADCGCFKKAETRVSELGEDDDLLPVGTKVRSYDFWVSQGKDSSYIEGVIEKIAPSPRCSPDCMHYHIRTTKTVRQGKEVKKDAIGEIFMTHPYEDFGWTLKQRKGIQVLDAEGKVWGEKLISGWSGSNLGKKKGAEHKTLTFMDWAKQEEASHLKKYGAEGDQHECITCAEPMGPNPKWSCECCGFLVGTQDDHEGCGDNMDGTVVCNHCYQEGHEVTTMVGGNEVIFNSTCKGWDNEKHFGDREYEVTNEYVLGAEAFGGDLASLEDFDGVESVVVEAPLGHGVTQYYAEDGEAVVPDPSSFPEGSGHVIGSQTPNANYTPLHAEDATAPDFDPLSETPGPHLDESAPSDSFEAMAVYQSGPGDVNKGMAALLNMVPSQVAKGNFISWGPKYLTVKEGSAHNKYLLFAVFKLDNGRYVAGNAYGRIGYGNPKTWFGPQMSSEGGAIREAEKKMKLKQRKKGYNLEFGAEAGDAPEESHPTDYDPLTASPSDEGGPDANFGWSESDADAGAFSAEFIANADTMYCAECFEAHCSGHDEYEAEDGPSPLDYDPLTEAPSDEGGPPAGPSDHFEAESNLNMAAGVGLVVGLIAAYKYSDKISDLFRKLGDE